MTDDQWERIRDVLPDQRTGPASKLGDRSFIDAVLYRTRTGIPWRDLPERFGPWKSVYNRFDNWASNGVWERVFKALRGDSEAEGSIVDGSVVRAHQDSAGGKGGSRETLLAALEEAFQPKSTRSSTLMVVRSTSRSRKGNATK
jgi:transposase